MSSCPFVQCLPGAQLPPGAFLPLCPCSAPAPHSPLPIRATPGLLSCRWGSSGWQGPNCRLARWPPLQAMPAAGEAQTRLLDWTREDQLPALCPEEGAFWALRMGLERGREPPLQGCLGCGEGAPRGSGVGTGTGGESRSLHHDQGGALGWGGVRSRGAPSLLTTGRQGSLWAWWGPPGLVQALRCCRPREDSAVEGPREYRRSSDLSCMCSV